jgi:hypothetical protein
LKKKAIKWHDRYDNKYAADTMLQTKGSTPVDNIEEQLQQLDIQHSKLKDNI